jgi:hypothetical protein
MSDRVEDLRREAAVCLAHAKLTSNPRVREELISMAARFHEQANSVQADSAGIVPAPNDVKTPPLPGSHSAVQQQQQIQPEEDGFGKSQVSGHDTETSD